jgi:hypothetical protein
MCRMVPVRYCLLVGYLVVSAETGWLMFSYRSKLTDLTMPIDSFGCMALVSCRWLCLSIITVSQDGNGDKGEMMGYRQQVCDDG